MVPAATGDTASAVLKTPYATHGCRPVSVTVEPQITATNPIHQACCAGHKYQRALNKRPRHHNHAPVSPATIISRPMPTIARNAKKGGRTGGRSFGGKSLRPGNRPSQLWVSKSEAPCGMVTAKRFVSVLSSGHA